MPTSVPTLLDQIYQQVTIVNMVLTPEERQGLYEPYLEILRDCRKQSGTSQADLAEAVNLSSKYVTLVEGGKRVPTVESLLALMAEAGVLRSTAEGMLAELMGRFKWEE
jgi:ribosome-binding protein aMBF1 (putative translation factor)